MSQTSTPTVIEDGLTVINLPGIGPAVVLSTVRAIKYADGITLKAALEAMNEQITASAAAVARNTADMADMKTWLTEQFGYTPQDHQTGNDYLTPLFTVLPKTPTGEGEL